MTDHPLDRLAPRGKPPTTVRAIETWIQQAEKKVILRGGGRMGLSATYGSSLGNGRWHRHLGSSSSLPMDLTAAHQHSMPLA
ncbi:MAG: hypothetical protein A2289_04715 [Deltaproteobacteria bacterium RIFOXYA12_FULL_58_15]|nr:MAG: hypothetical protein A2289_04715 [Deltaproteobacteria bacterium RIFOXYA12_FULL_58_15]OGR09892.1 MAG: hypothetical protein A2341_27245 [Deltaproteobacteria bacterium RIFOXYB12_FULL_58_9]